MTKLIQKIQYQWALNSEFRKRTEIILEGEEVEAACTLEARHIAKPIAGQIRLDVRWILASYFMAIAFSLCILLFQFTLPYARLGALLILFPTVLTGIHVFNINMDTNRLKPIFEKLGNSSFSSCNGCRRIEKHFKETEKILTSNLRLVIICETLCASVGTALWAFGDCFESGGCWLT